MTPTLAAAFLCVATAALADPCEAPLPKPGATFAGRVEHVGDGDGFCVTSPRGLIEVRIADFYAKELNEPGGRAAKATLSRIAMGREVQCVGTHYSWDRIVATCRIGRKSVGDLMRDAGVAGGGKGFYSR